MYSPKRTVIGQRPNILYLILTNIDHYMNNVNAGTAIGRSDQTLNVNLSSIIENSKLERYLNIKGNYKEMNKYIAQAINIHTSYDTEAITIRTTKGISLHTNNQSPQQ